MKKRYFVRLAFTMLNDTESDAVQDVVDLFAEHGTRSWVYVVDDADSGERIGYFNGWGEPLSTEDVEAAADGARSIARNTEAATRSGDDEQAEPAPGQPDTDDDELEQLAEALNGGDS